MLVHRSRRTLRTLAVALALALAAVTAAVNATRAALRGEQRHGARAHEERSIVGPVRERVDKLQDTL